MGIFTSITSEIEKYTNKVSSSVTEVTNSIGTDLEKFGGSFTSAVENFSSDIKVYADSAESFVSDVFNGVSDITGEINSAVSDISELLGDVVNFDASQYGSEVVTSVESIVNAANIGSTFGANTLADVRKPGPNKRLTNPLSEYASFNTIFTLGTITPNSIANPRSTYKVNGPDYTVLRSGGGFEGNRVQTPAEQGVGNVEYFIDNVEMKSVIAPNNKTGPSPATTLTFTVTEPFSLGLFMQSLKIAAMNAGFANYATAVYLLQVEFVGWNQDGQPVSLPGLKRHFPMHIVDIQFSTTASGSVYEVSAIPANEVAFSDEAQCIKTDISAIGITVADVLNNSQQNIAKAINSRHADLQESKIEPFSDYYVINFPTNRNSDLSAKGEQVGDSATIDEATRSVSAEYTAVTGKTTGLPDDFAAFIAATGVQRIDSNLFALLQNKARSDINAIGRALLLKTPNDGGDHPMGKVGFTWNGITHIYDRSNVELQTSDAVRQFSFKQGEKIQNIIMETILQSDYGRAVIDEQRKTADGMIPWVKIESKVYYLGDANTQATKGRMPRVYVYDVVKYDVSATKFSSPGASVPGIKKLKEQAVKEYNYIYTGINDDIINFDINVRAGFFQTLKPDLGNAGEAQRSRVSEGPNTENNDPVVIASPNTDINPTEGTGTSEIAYKKQHSAGGNRVESPETSVARSFHDAILDGVDFLQTEIKIWGDPYFLPDTGFGNYSAEPGASATINADYTMDYQRSEIDILINFRTPIDYDSSGVLRMLDESTSSPVKPFSGLYQVLEVTSEISGNEFTQTLSCIRRPNQDKPETSVKNTAMTISDDPSQNINETGVIATNDVQAQTSTVSKPSATTTSAGQKTSTAAVNSGNDVRQYMDVQLTHNIYDANQGVKRVAED